MKFYFLLVIFMIGFVSAGVQICIDLDDPSAPFNLSVSGNVGSILLEWDAAVDEPSCSGIDEYVISREGVEIGRVGGDVLSFIDSDDLENGEYTYTVYAVDLVGRNTGAAIKNVVQIGGNDGGGTSGGSSSLSFVCVEDWSCDEWSGCVGGEQRRLCSDVSECGTVDDRPEVYQSCGESSGGDDMIIDSSLDGGDVGGIGGFFSVITGAVVGGGAKSVAAVGVFLVLVLGGFFIVRRRKNKSKK